MPDDRHIPKETEAERQARKLAALLDEAAEEFERNGAMSPADLRQRLEALEVAWAAEEASQPGGGKAHRRLR